jgi:hypothetical protein
MTAAASVSAGSTIGQVYRQQRTPETLRTRSSRFGLNGIYLTKSTEKMEIDHPPVKAIANDEPLAWHAQYR